MLKPVLIVVLEDVGQFLSIIFILGVPASVPSNETGFHHFQSLPFAPISITWFQSKYYRPFSQRQIFSITLVIDTFQ
jgi:hypothetical protein